MALRAISASQMESIKFIIMTVPTDFTLRPATPDDAALFYSVIDRNMCEFILATWGRWDEARVQSESQASSRSPNAQVIQIDNVGVGVFTVARYPTYIQLEQIYLLPEYQRLGIGTALTHTLITEAKESIVPIRLRVMAVNPAKHFYEHLGFIITESTPEFFSMEKAP
jgi:ribosomal protein S18 acetylase RimI-like enzyme